MNCLGYRFSSHAIKRMFERKITKKDALSVIQKGEVIADYSEDKPYPSYLIYAKIGDRPIHVLTAFNKVDNMCYIITVYEPDKKIWENDFKTRRQR